jgi:hypothetical protein
MTNQARRLRMNRCRLPITEHAFMDEFMDDAIVDKPIALQCGSILAFIPGGVVVCTERQGHPAGECWAPALSTLDWCSAELAPAVSIAAWRETLESRTEI